jgi:hypothetical protein
MDLKRTASSKDDGYEESSSTKSKSLFHLLSTHATTIVAEVLEVLETQVPGYLSAAFRPQFCYPPCISTT